MITLTGNSRLPRDVALRTTRSGKTVATISVASDRRDCDAQPVYVDLIVWQGQATAAPQHLVMGQAVASPDASNRANTSAAPARTASRSSCTASTSSTGPSLAATGAARRRRPRPTRPNRTTFRSEPRSWAGRRASGPPPNPTNARRPKPRRTPRRTPVPKWRSSRPLRPKRLTRDGNAAATALAIGRAPDDVSRWPAVRGNGAWWRRR
jgi:single-stranded DNA-binding protein